MRSNNIKESRIFLAITIFYVIFLPYDSYIPIILNILYLIFLFAIILKILRGAELVLTREQVYIICMFIGIIIMAILTIIKIEEFPPNHLRRLLFLLAFPVATLFFIISLDTPIKVFYIWTILSLNLAVIGVGSIINIFYDIPFWITTSERALIGLSIPRSTLAGVSWGSYGLLATGSICFCIKSYVSFDKMYENRKYWSRPIFLAVGVIILSAIIFGQSRSTYIALVCSISTLIFLEYIYPYVIEYKSVLILMLMGIITSTYYAVPIILKLSKQSYVDTSRYEQYSTALEVIANNPILGKGFTYSQQIHPEGVHNFWLEMGVGIGGISLLLFAAIFLTVFVSTYKIYLIDNDIQSTSGQIMLAALIGGSIELMANPGTKDFTIVLISLGVATINIIGLEVVEQDLNA